MDKLRTFLAAHSKVFQELTEDATIDELFSCYECNRELLERLPALYTDRYKISNVELDGKHPYDSLCGCSVADLHELCAVSDYIGLPDMLITKLKCLIRSIETNKYCVPVGNEIHVFTPGDISCADFALVGDLRGLQWAHECRMEWDSFTCSNAASEGYLDCLQYAHDPPSGDRCPWNDYAFNCAASNGHLECLQYLYANECPYNALAAYDAAAAGHIECVKWLHVTGIYEVDEIIAEHAAPNGHFDIVKYAYESCGKLNAKIFINTARGGHLHMLQWLCEQSESIWLSCKDTVCLAASKGGHNHIVDWCCNKKGCTYPVVIATQPATVQKRIRSMGWSLRL